MSLSNLDIQEAMSVYVDDMYKLKMGEYRGMKMSHLMADTKEELLAMIDKIGVKRKWIQDEGKWSEHFDICLAKRELAVKAGAIEIVYGGKEHRELLAKKRKENNLLC